MWEEIYRNTKKKKMKAQQTQSGRTGESDLQLYTVCLGIHFKEIPEKCLLTH
jgi:hypothetical protein